MKGVPTALRALPLAASERWGGLYARHSDPAAAGGTNARPIARIRLPRRSWGDLLMAGAIALAMHGAFFASGFFFPSEPPSAIASAAAPTEATEVAVVSFVVDEPVEAEEPAGELSDPAPSDAAAPVAATIVPLDLLRPQVGSYTLNYARFTPTIGGTGGGFHVDSSVLQRSGHGTRLPVFELAELDQSPVILAQPLPQYPPSLLRTGASGEVLVCFVVGLDGAVRTARVVRTTHPEFAVPALQAVARWKFRPGRKDGRAVATRVEVPIAFSVPTVRPDRPFAGSFSAPFPSK